MENNKRTEISEFGEFGLIKHLSKHFTLQHKESILGIGDDAAIIKPSGDSMLISNDMLLEGVHFDLTYTPLKHLGYKAVVINISDILAMNAQPKQISLGLGVSNRFSVEAIEEIYAGIRQACSTYKIDLIGGDTSSSRSGLVLSVSIYGYAEENRITQRGGAKENDLICVSGHLGAAYMGLMLLEREKEVFKQNPEMQPDLSGNESLLERQLKPEARVDIIDFLREEDITPTAMIDISDGLGSELMHLCRQSEKGCAVYEEKIPIHPDTSRVAKEFNLNAITPVLNGGEDYELLFTIRQSDFDKIQKNTDISVIGHITDAMSGINLITNAGQAVELKAQGWDSDS